jgi:alanine dehydrogenase
VPTLFYLSAADVARCGLTMREVIDLVELALAEHGNGRTEMPPKLGVHPQAGSLLHAMPAFVPAAHAAGMKWVAAFPANRNSGLPAVSGIIVLSDAETGLPQAVLDASWITAARTGASAAVAARRLAPGQAETLAIIGPGVVGRATVAAMREVLPRLKRVRAYAPRTEAAESFARDMSKLHSIDAQVAPSPNAAVEAADAVVTAAPWPRMKSAPALDAAALADIPFCCALDLDSTVSPEAAAGTVRLFADDLATFESHRQRGFFSGWPAPAELSHVIAGKLPAREANERVICVNLGLGIYDVVVAQRVFEVARNGGIGTELPL